MIERHIGVAARPYFRCQDQRVHRKAPEQAVYDGARINGSAILKRCIPPKARGHDYCNRKTTATTLFATHWKTYRQLQTSFYIQQTVETGLVVIWVWCCGWVNTFVLMPVFWQQRTLGIPRLTVVGKNIELFWARCGTDWTWVVEPQSCYGLWGSLPSILPLTDSSVQSCFEVSAFGLRFKGAFRRGCNNRCGPAVVRRLYLKEIHQTWLKNIIEPIPCGWSSTIAFMISDWHLLSCSYPQCIPNEAMLLGWLGWLFIVGYLKQIPARNLIIEPVCHRRQSAVGVILDWLEVLREAGKQGRKKVFLI